MASGLKGYFQSQVVRAAATQLLRSVKTNHNGWR